MRRLGPLALGAFAIAIAGAVSGCASDSGRAGGGGTFGTPSAEGASSRPAGNGDALVEAFIALVTSDDFSFRAEQSRVAPGADPDELSASFVVEGDDAEGTILVGGGVTAIDAAVVGESGYIQHLYGSWQRVSRVALDTLGVHFDLFAFIDSPDDLRHEGPSDELGEPLQLLVNTRPLELEQGPSAQEPLELGEVTDLEILVRGDGVPVLMRYVVRGGDISGGTEPEETVIRFSDVGADFDISPPPGFSE